MFFNKKDKAIISKGMIVCHHCGRFEETTFINGRPFMDGLPHICDECLVKHLDQAIEDGEKQMAELKQEMIEVGILEEGE